MDKKIKNIIKIVLVGESTVGKTCLIRAFLDKKFQDTVSSFSFESVKKEIKRGDTTYNVFLWDTAGQEKFRSLGKLFIKDSQIVILVYDMANRKSFQELSFWANYAEELLGKYVTLGVAGNKIDLFQNANEDEDDDKYISYEEGKKYADEIGALFRETSAKESPKDFQDFVVELIDKFLNNRKETEKEWEVLSFEKYNKMKKKSKCFGSK